MLFRQNIMKRPLIIGLIGVILLIIMVSLLLFMDMFTELRIWNLNWQYNNEIKKYEAQIKNGPDDIKEALRFIKEDESINNSMEKLELISSKVQNILENSNISSTRKKQLYGLYNDMNDFNEAHRHFKTLYDQYDKMTFSEKLDAKMIITHRKVRYKDR